QALTSLRMLVERFPPHFRLRVLDEKNTFGEALNPLIAEGLLHPSAIDTVPRRMPTFRDRVIVEDGLFYRFARWVLSLRGVSVGSSPLARYLDNSDTDLVYFVTPTTSAHELQIKPFVWTLWDLCHLDSPEFPEVRTSGKFEAREATISQNLRKAALAIVDSPELEENARRSYGITSDKFVTIPFAPPAGILENQSNAVSLHPEVQDIASRYVFYPAQLWTHKNHRRIAEAIAILKGRGRDIHAVFVGKDHGAGASLRRSIQDLGVEDSIHFLGYVEDEMVPELYRASLGLVMASYFGPTNIPPLEALLLGVPVIASNQHTQQLGDAAIFFDPDDAEQLASAIESLSSPATRKKLAARGKALLAALDHQRSEGYDELSRRIELLAKRLLR
ncbi:MAG TPA: glycosyltransferase family 1 protein, partial [Pontimonas sp.]|nr:glycosyltransferase family 1 protein [Pontimonas sp.]